MIAVSSLLYYYTSPFHYMTGNLTPATFDHILFMSCLIHTEIQSGLNKVDLASSWSGKPQSIKLSSDLSIREKAKN